MSPIIDFDHREPEPEPTNRTNSFYRHRDEAQGLHSDTKEHTQSKSEDHTQRMPRQGQSLTRSQAFQRNSRMKRKNRREFDSESDSTNSDTEPKRRCIERRESNDAQSVWNWTESQKRRAGIRLLQLDICNTRESTSESSKNNENSEDSEDNEGSEDNEDSEDSEDNENSENSLDQHEEHNNSIVQLLDSDDEVELVAVRPPHNLRRQSIRGLGYPSEEDSPVQVRPRNPARQTQGLMIDLSQGDDDEALIVPRQSRILNSSTISADSNAEPNTVENPDASVMLSNNDTLEKMQLKCTICLDVMTRVHSAKCGHIFHRECIHRAIQSTKRCPLCRKPLKLADVHPVFI